MRAPSRTPSPIRTMSQLDRRAESMENSASWRILTICPSPGVRGELTQIIKAFGLPDPLAEEVNFPDARSLGQLITAHRPNLCFIDVTRNLVANRYADRNKVFAMGGSAGGLLMGAIANMSPGDYRGIVAQVPFVDVVTTMLDDSIPLTSNEYDEWGDPHQRCFHDYMLEYSPYDNVRAQPYPAMLVTTGIWDSQVQYYEPAKWVAKLRALKTDSNDLFLHVDMDAGHGGKSGRFQRYREIAREYAFILQQLQKDP